MYHEILIELKVVYYVLQQWIIEVLMEDQMILYVWKPECTQVTEKKNKIVKYLKNNDDDNYNKKDNNNHRQEK